MISAKFLVLTLASCVCIAVTPALADFHCSLSRQMSMCGPAPYIAKCDPYSSVVAQYLASDQVPKTAAFEIQKRGPHSGAGRKLEFKVSSKACTISVLFGEANQCPDFVSALKSHGIDPSQVGSSEGDESQVALLRGVDLSNDSYVYRKPGCDGDSLPEVPHFWRVSDDQQPGVADGQSESTAPMSPDSTQGQGGGSSSTD